MPVFIIETESRFKMQYAVEADTFDKAFKAIQSGIDEFHQEHKGELLVDASVATCDKDLVYEIRKTTGLYKTWSDEKLLEVFKNVD